ncbi:MAG: hypothetical protein V7L04_31735 [Nostoc sp.]|uniref:hypothetical protein n=1 Tax=Nostoc sp. TaxID=1180 RepID=UPI002FFABC40
MFPVTLQGLGKWELVYSGTFSLSESAKSLEPREIPLLADNRYLVVGARSTLAKPTWIRAGYLTQFLENINVDDNVIFPGTGNPGNTVDTDTKIIKLNVIQLVIFPDLATTYRLFFTPVRWLKNLNLSI